MALKTPRKRGLPAKLSTLFTHELPAISDPPMALWLRFISRRGVAERDALFQIYAPWVAILVGKLLLRQAGYFTKSDLDDMRANGCIGLLRAIDCYDPSRGGFPNHSARYIIWFIRKGHEKMRWGGRRLNRENWIISRVRAGLVQEHGRVPTHDELAAELRGVITNPNIHIGNHEPISLSPAMPGERGIDPADTREAPAIFRAMGKEAMRLAMKDMRPQDVRIFKLLIKGKTDVQIAKRLGVSRQRIGQRLNGVLWELRSRADLAEYLGVKPENPPAGTNRQNRPSPYKFPPAQLAG